jgi:hypothetical protein
MNLEEKVRLYKEISQQITNLEEQKKNLSQSILQEMEGKSLQIGSYQVKRTSRLSISTTLDQARSYQATKMEEIVDKEKIKTIHSADNPIPGVKTIEYILVTAK